MMLYIKKILRIPVIAILLVSPIHAADVAQEYQPNYKINDSWDKILDIFVKIEAQSNIGEEIDTDTFSELNGLFEDVFPYLPQNKNYKIIYEQCTLLTEKLTEEFNYNDFSNFLTNCHAELTRVIKEINSKYTIKPDVKFGPNGGPAPLTVTLDGRGSSDPSNDTIPSENFFWYYKDIDGVDKIIGRGSVTKHTFAQEGNYFVHLTVRSANNENEGILDGEKTVNINVSPQSAIISVYANGQKMDENTHIKIGHKEAKQGVHFDGNSTTPQGGRQIMSHWWDIVNNGGFSYKSKKNKGGPGSIKVPLPENGEYTIKLTTIDNENNQMEKEFVLKVSDPIAMVKQTPEAGDTTTEFLFDSTKSYSIQSRIKLQTREVFDSKGEKTYTTQKQNFSQKFTKPGPYNVKLTVTDEAGDSDEETVTINVESAPPVAQFTMTPVADREFPSQFLLDASKTTDSDVTNKFDTLSYNRQFSNEESVKIDKEYGTDKKIIVASFDKAGTYQAKLTAKDSFGKVSEKTMDIEVVSALRPVVLASPKAAVRGTPITFAVKANKENIISYERDFGDGETRNTQTNKITHSYKKVGVYHIKLKASTKLGEENSIKTPVFIGEKDSPIAVYKITDTLQNIRKETETCEIETEKSILKAGSTEKTGKPGDKKEMIEITAYGINRYEEFKIDMLESVNTKGGRDGLKSFFQPEDDEIYTKQNFSYKFMDLGCHYIDVTVEDTVAGKNDKKRVRFKVFNALPTLDTMTLGFPQYGNEIGVGFEQNNGSKQNILEDKKFDPLIIKIEAEGSRDPDGNISYYTRYYYDKNNPDRILESKISPGSIPYSYFSLPKTVPGEYVFGVRMTDSDGGEIASEEIIGSSQSLLFSPDSKNLDIPMVTVIPDRINIKAGEEVTFTVKAKILSQRKDFVAKRTIRYDFNGDGEIDMTTKDDVVKYVYKEPNTDGLTPRVEVIYRGYKGTAFAEKITIKEGLKPVLLYTIIDKILLVRDMSIGSIAEKRMCFDRSQCKTNPKYVATDLNKNIFVFPYPTYGTYITEYTIKDSYGNVATDRQVLKIEKQVAKNLVDISSLPARTEKDGEKSIHVGENLGNAVLFYVTYRGEGDCFVDANIGVDSDGNGTPDDDRDVVCNEASPLVKYDPSFGSALGRIYYMDPEVGAIQTETFSVEFLDFEVVLSPEKQKIYDNLTDVIKRTDPTLSGNKTLIPEIIKLRNNIESDVDVANGILMIHSLLDGGDTFLGDIERQKLDVALKDLGNGATAAALGQNAYFQAKQEILSILPPNLKTDVSSIFSQIESVESPAESKEQIKTLVQNMLKLLIENTASSMDTQGENQILQEDMDLTVLPMSCSILKFYEIPSEKCDQLNAGTAVQAQAIAEKTSSGLGSILKRVLIVLGIIAVAFIGIVVFFAIKAKQQEKEPDVSS